MSCIFCKIVDKEIPSYTIYEDDIVKCFLDNCPDSNGHTLIIPKKHYQDLNDIDLDTLNHIMKVSKIISTRISSRLNCAGLTLIQNNGLIQEVKHYHLHIKPYYKEEQEKKSLEEIYEILKEV